MSASNGTSSLKKFCHSIEVSVEGNGSALVLSFVNMICCKSGSIVLRLNKGMTDSHAPTFSVHAKARAPHLRQSGAGFPWKTLQSHSVTGEPRTSGQSTDHGVDGPHPSWKGTWVLPTAQRLNLLAFAACTNAFLQGSYGQIFRKFPLVASAKLISCRVPFGILCSYGKHNF